MSLPRSQELVNSLSINEVPSSLQNRYEYNDDGDVLYAGSAPRGLASSADGWTIFQYTYDNRKLILKQAAFDSWDAREVASFS